jgi:HicA toxin of bacterial toxin-antitoxin,
MQGGLKVLSGEDLVAIFTRFGFVVVGGSKHVKLRRSFSAGDETLVIPNHDPIAKGTLRAIFLQASHYIPQSQLRPHFYNE